MNNVKRRASARKVLKPMAKVLGVALALSATNAGAIGPVQETGPALWQHILNQINTYQARFQEKYQFVKENTQWARDWAQTIKEYQETMVQIQGIVNSFGLPDSAPLTPVPPNYLVAETCGIGTDLKTRDPGRFQFQGRLERSAATDLREHPDDAEPQVQRCGGLHAQDDAVVLR